MVLSGTYLAASSQWVVGIIRLWVASSALISCWLLVRHLLVGVLWLGQMLLLVLLHVVLTGAGVEPGCDGCSVRDSNFLFAAVLIAASMLVMGQIVGP